ncbi:MAG: Stk1 family PASTA domain-containing Ser/Thr kinase [Thomasclavelia sp.]|jgi:serine/threonine protein kinase|nr:Stk1 family PASTA domain-containing Ser/Thr kinase [Thomasclavelia sp.]
MNKIIAGRYELIDLIGQGGMADVYLAKDNILNRTIAVKVLRTSLAKDPIYITRFQREASAAASLSHRNIVEIYDVGEDEDQYYIVMEYVPGTTLKELIHKRGALHVAEAVDIMKQVTSGASKAHQLGIIHRDLKPQNILVTDSGVAKIADFGIASMQNLAQVTQTDVIMGSLHYLAPELARGEKATIQSDIYALGIVMYELLRGEVPFNGESPVNIALKHMQEDLPSLRDFNPSIPQSVENIVIKATAKNPADRYANAGEMLADLETCFERKNEEKLVFATPVDDEPTIVLDPKTAFSNNDDTPVNQNNQPVQEEKKSIIDKFKALPTKAKVGIIGGGIVAIALVAFLVMSLMGGSNDPSVMPDLRGMTQSEAKETLKDYDVKVNKTVYKELSDTYKKDQIISTDPSRGRTIKSGDTVTFTVSKGKYIVLKDYVGKTIDEAKKALEDKGFTVEVDYEISDKTKGTVTAQSLAKGYKQDPTVKDRSITLTVSKGSYVVVGNYVGTSYDDAKSKLEALGFVVSKKEESSEEASGTVTAQSLQSGYKVDPEDTDRKITLTVSSGYSASVPNVIGLSVSSARSTLENAGFTVKTDILSPSSASDPSSVELNVVTKQSPSSGTSVTSKGTSVTITYYSN